MKCLWTAIILSFIAVIVNVMFAGFYNELRFADIVLFAITVYKVVIFGLDFCKYSFIMSFGVLFFIFLFIKHFRTFNIFFIQLYALLVLIFLMICLQNIHRNIPCGMLQYNQEKNYCRGRVSRPATPDNHIVTASGEPPPLQT